MHAMQPIIFKKKLKYLKLLNKKNENSWGVNCPMKASKEPYISLSLFESVSVTSNHRNGVVSAVQTNPELFLNYV